MLDAEEGELGVDKLPVSVGVVQSIHWEGVQVVPLKRLLVVKIEVLAVVSPNRNLSKNAKSCAFCVLGNWQC